MLVTAAESLIGPTRTFRFSSMTQTVIDFL